MSQEQPTRRTIENADSQQELLEIAESDPRTGKMDDHNGFVWFTVTKDSLINLYKQSDPMTALNCTRYSTMAIGIGKPTHSALN